MKNFKVIAVLAGLMAMFTLAGCGGEQKKAEKWPTENIKVIVPFGAGGSVDRMARGWPPTGPRS